MTKFMGETIGFWIELKAKADTLDVAYLIRENAAMRAKVSYFDDMVRRAGEFKSVVDGFQVKEGLE